MPEQIPVDDDLRDDLKHYFGVVAPTEMPRRVLEMTAHSGRRTRRPSQLRAGLATLGVLGAVVLTGITVHLLDGRGTAATGATGASSRVAAGTSPLSSGSGKSAGVATTTPGAVFDPLAAGLLPAAPIPGSFGSGANGTLGTGPASVGSGGTSAAPTTPIIVGSPPTATIERSVTATYTVPSGAFLESFQGLISRAVGLGGFVVSSSTHPDSKGRIVSGGVALKVPTARVADFLNGMPSGFTVSSIDFASIDHTAAFVDVNARLGSARAHLAALNALLTRTYNLGDIANLEQQVELVQTEIDTEQGQLNVLQASVDLSTATVSLSERGAPAVTSPAPAKAGPVSGGVADGWSHAVAVTGAILEGVISALPAVLLAVIAGLIAWRGSRWIRRRRDMALGL